MALESKHGLTLNLNALIPTDGIAEMNLRVISSPTTTISMQR